TENADADQWGVGRDHRMTPPANAKHSARPRGITATNNEPGQRHPVLKRPRHPQRTDETATTDEPRGQDHRMTPPANAKRSARPGGITATNNEPGPRHPVFRKSKQQRTPKSKQRRTPGQPEDCRKNGVTRTRGTSLW